MAWAAHLDQLVHALWNPTDVDAVVIEFISPAGFEGFFEEIGALDTGSGPEIIGQISIYNGQTPQPELIAKRE